MKTISKYHLPIKIIPTNTLLMNITLGRFYSRLTGLLKNSNIKYYLQSSKLLSKLKIFKQYIFFLQNKKGKTYLLKTYLSKNPLYIHIKYLYSMLSSNQKSYFLQYFLL